MKNNNFTFCLGKSRENVVNIFQDFPGLKNKIQGLSRVTKKIQDFPGLFQDVATLKHKRLMQQQFHVENWTDALDTAFFHGAWHM